MWQSTPILSLVILLSCGLDAAASPQLDARQATVVIEGEIKTAQGPRVEIGAGVIVGQRDGLLILTAYHVADHPPLTVITSDSERLKVLDVEQISSRDLALIKTPIPDRLYPAMKIAPAGAAGSTMFTYGAPNNQRWLLGLGELRDSRLLPAPFTNGEIAMLCSTCNHGSSGGGIFNARGELEGILTQACTAADGVYTFVAEPIVDFSDVLARM